MLALSISAAYAEQEKAVGVFGWNGVGKTYELNKGHFYWVGEFTGTFSVTRAKGDCSTTRG
jgi:hypothetical protein